MRLKENKLVKGTILCYCLFLSSVMLSQSDRLMPSISFEKSLNFGPSKKVFEIDYVGYPKDLNSSKLFFIEIKKEDIKKNYSVIYGPKFKGINKNVVSKMTKNYPYAFESFLNEYQSKELDYFLEKGFKYRLLINSTWYQVISNRTDRMSDIPAWKQNFMIVVQDIQTGKIYGHENWQWYLKYVNKFIDKVKI